MEHREASHPAFGAVGEETRLGEPYRQSDICEDGIRIHRAGGAVQPRGQVEGEGAGRGGLPEGVEAAAEPGHGFGQAGAGADAEESVQQDTGGGRCGLPPGESVRIQGFTAACLSPFAGGQGGPFRRGIGGDQVHLPAGLGEKPGGNQGVAPVVALAENRGAVARDGAKLAHGQRHFAAGLFHERFCVCAGGEGGLLEGLHLLRGDHAVESLPGTGRYEKKGRSGQ